VINHCRGILNMKLNVTAGCLILFAAIALASCATPKVTVQEPDVILTGVQVKDIGLGGQKFLLGFSVSNPNPFPLPVKSIRYNVRLDDQKFAGGETQSDFVVSARGDGTFIIGVELDLLQSVSQLMSLLKGGMRETIEYELQGSLVVDIPFSRPVPFASSGIIRVRSGS
jgi:LEA14-like dessication related protein